MTWKKYLSTSCYANKSLLFVVIYGDYNGF